MRKNNQRIILLVDLLCVIVFAHATRGRLYILRDYDTEDKTRVNNAASSKLMKTISNAVKFKPKKQAVVHYGRHIYHMDSFNKLHRLRTQHNPDYISYDYIDIGDINALKSGRSVPKDYIEDILRLTLPCNGRKCREDQRKYTNAAKKNKLKKKRKNSSSTLDYKKLRKRRSKRFKVVDNRYKHIASKPQEKITSQKSYKKNHGMNKKQTKFNKKKYIPPESASAESNESKDSNSESVEVKKVKKKKIYSSESDSSSDESTEAPKKLKKKYFNSGSESNEGNDFSNSIEDNQKKRKKKKQKYGSSEEVRKHFNSDGLVLQGNKMYDAYSGDNDLEDQRKRMSHFLPKRYHWDPSEIHDLGYYWFNGPKGRYPAPKTVS